MIRQRIRASQMGNVRDKFLLAYMSAPILYLDSIELIAYQYRSYGLPTSPHFSNLGYAFYTRSTLMTCRSILTLSILGVAGLANANDFADPVRMQANGEVIHIDDPGYASPSWTDIDNDGDADLLVGQLVDGQIQIFRNEGDGTLAAGEFLRAGDEIVQVPGIG